MSTYQLPYGDSLYSIFYKLSGPRVKHINSFNREASARYVTTPLRIDDLQSGLVKPISSITIRFVTNCQLTLSESNKVHSIQNISYYISAQARFNIVLMSPLDANKGKLIYDSQHTSLSFDKESLIAKDDLGQRITLVDSNAEKIYEEIVNDFSLSMTQIINSMAKQSARAGNIELVDFN